MYIYIYIYIYRYETNATVDQLCVESDATNIIVFLLVCASIKFILTIFGPNTIVPGGHMVPSMAVGHTFSKVLYIVTFYVGKFSKVLHRDFL